MAVVRKRGKSWQAIVRLKGHPALSATRATKREAEEWAKQQEADILAGRRGRFPLKTVADALKRYELEVTVHKRTRVNEGKRLSAIQRDFPWLMQKIMHTVTPADLARWRDVRLQKVKPSTVLRDVTLLRNVWSVASREWMWCEPDVWKSVKLPKDAPPREAVWRWQEMRLMLRRLGYRTGLVPALGIQQIACMFLIALHTAMRAGEVRQLRREDVDLERRVITLETHKTVATVGTRRVPITRRAARMLKPLCDATNSGPLFTVEAGSMDMMFRRRRDQMGLGHLTFHDARATALTLLAKKVQPLVLARISGHRDLRTLMNVYYRASAEEIAAGL